MCQFEVKDSELWDKCEGVIAKSPLSKEETCCSLLAKSMEPDPTCYYSKEESCPIKEYYGNGRKIS